jgi:RecB family exonuclease
MGITACISSMSHRRIARARAWLKARAPAEEVLIIGANLDAANELARSIVQTTGAAFGWHRITLAQLAAVLAAPTMAARGIVSVGSLGVEAIVHRAVHALGLGDALGRYVSIAEGPGFARAIAGVLTEVRLAGLAPEALGGVDPDLLRLLQAYETELAEGKLTDWPGMLAIATEMAANRPTARRWVELPKLLLDVPIASKAELSLVATLCSSPAEMLATVPGADERTLSRLREELRVQIEDLDEPSSALDDGNDRSGSLARLQRHLFSKDDTPTISLPDDQVLVFSAPGENRECAEIVRRVLALAREGLAFDRMAVLLRSPQEYSAHLEEALARADVPVHLARGAVRPDPAGRAFCVLLRCAAEGLSARRFAEYLSLGQVPDAVPGGTPPEPTPRSERWVAPDQERIPYGLAGRSDEVVPCEATDASAIDDNGGPVIAGQLRAPRRWEHFLMEAAVIGGEERWRRRIDGLANELRLKLAELGDEDEARAVGLARTLGDLDAFAGYALPLIEVLGGLPASAHWGEWLDQLGALATRGLRQPDRVLSVLAELAPMASVGPVTLDEVLSVLSDLLLEVAAPPPAQRYGRVFVGPVEAARGLSFEAVFVPGMAEKLFPHKIVEEPILLDEARERLNAGLVTNEDRLARERLALALAAGATERRLILSYPRLDLSEGRPRVPSFYALEAVRAAEGRLPDFAELARQAETETSARIGWPAPSDPAAAIDDAEYDLAVLEQLFRASKQRGGSARYLLKANPYVARALRTRYQRWSFHWTPADGLVSPSETVRAIMAQHGLNARSYSPTTLQHYAGCPYKFFLQAVHRLAPREVPEAIDELDPLQRGSLVHDVQFELFERLHAKKLLPVRPRYLEQAREVLDAVIVEVAARYYDDLAPAIDRIWEDGIAAIRADLREWLRRASEDGSAYVPWHFEMSFGLGDGQQRRTADPLSVPGAVELDCGIRLRGSIDLVERHPSGLVRVTDHKTGKAQGKAGQLVAGGASLQPVLYALAAEKLFGAGAKVECGRLYFCTSAGGFSEHIVPLDDPARRAADAVADAIRNAIDGPFLPAAPLHGECDWCDYRPVCGPYEEQRTGRKPQETIEELLRLRDLP